ncbi:putative mitochondrial-processing peptidase subunit beta mitochondrial [Prunus yedoensis var. nudiflora]|uniref:Putative mitochondrial-processing peptidase subunit beta mitochondrial n=1 Tax=Prunus yedoensis var. nudiflora TaxID=2094558 RepID=A0A314Z9I2_PRUYE|nr:putative mitochondrial-processing peptidase subunit beta mitochondrial [Prunus yedoensis var. nudiflora]
MAMKHLLTTIARRRPHRPPAALTVAVRSSSTSPAVAESPSAPSLPSPPPPSAMIYDRLAEDVKSKIRTLENPDPRFLKYGSPTRVSRTIPTSSPHPRHVSPHSPTACESPPSRTSRPRRQPSGSGSMLGRGSRTTRPTAPRISWST